MIKIIKGPEPEEWREKRLRTPGAVYEPTHELRAALLNEQGFICAYCTSRIAEDNSKVEHIKCRSKYPALQLNYDNMVICCEGITKGETHCDTKKENDDISFDLFSDYFFTTLSYSSRNGTIKSSDGQYNKEINEVLNLNHKFIQSNRRARLDALRIILEKRNWSQTEIRKQLMKYQERDKDNRFESYPGIVIWYLQRKVKAL